jgi:hypothetical protein
MVVTNSHNITIDFIGSQQWVESPMSHLNQCTEFVSQDQHNGKKLSHDFWVVNKTQGRREEHKRMGKKFGKKERVRGEKQH